MVILVGNTFVKENVCIGINRDKLKKVYIFKHLQRK